MTSAIDICNEALATIGARSTMNSFSEVSKEAVACRLFYNPLRKSILRAAHWGFARKQVLLTELGNTRTIATFLGACDQIGIGGVPQSAGNSWIGSLGTSAPV